MLPYLEVFQAHGRAVAFYRRDGRRRRLRGPDGVAVDPADKAALTAAWNVAHAEHVAADADASAAAAGRAVRPRSMADLIQRYRASPEWAEKKPATRLDYEKALGPLERDFADRPAADLMRHHVTAIRDRYAWRQEPVPDKPGETRRVVNARQANRVVTVLSILLSHAVDPLGWRPDNPAFRPKRLQRKTDGYRAWTQDEVAQFLDRAPAEWRFAALLALLTAQRGQDQVAMSWSDFDGARIHVVQQKGRGLVKLWVPAHAVLLPLLAARRRRSARLSPAPLTILYREDGQPWPVNAFQKAAGAQIRAAGLEGVVWHGLRATAMSWAAEGGASEKAMMALSGHRTSGMAHHYARSADQERLAGDAVAAISLPKKAGRRRTK